MVKLASGIARGRVRTATEMSHNMVAILQLIGHAALVNSVHLCYRTSILWSIDTCQNKVSADQCHVVMLRAQVLSSSRSIFFLKLLADQVPAFRFDRGLKPGYFYCNQDRVVRN